MQAEAWSAERERARREALVRDLGACGLSSPAWVLCPREPLRAALTAQLAAHGGGFVRFVDWNVLAHSLDDLLGLPFAAPIAEVDRAYIVERALFARAARMPQLAAPLRSDPFGVAVGLLRVVDLLRAHRWHGVLSPRPHAPDAAGALVDEHLGLLGELLEALEAQLAARGQLDTLGRLGRAEGALRGHQRPRPGRLWVDGVDRLAPLERDLLRALLAAGWWVSVAPWVEGWSGAAALPDAEALDAGVSVTVVHAADVHAEAEAVAEYVAEAVARGAMPEDFSVVASVAGAAGDRVREALRRWGVAASGQGSLAVTRSPLWQLVRAAVRLVWTGVDVVDLATLFAAPGSGLWGAERDRFIARLRRSVPSTWEAVRSVLWEVTEPLPPAPDAAGTVTPEDARKRGLLAEMRTRAGGLLQCLSSHGPFAAIAPTDRVEGLDAVVSEVLDRFCKPSRFGEALHDPRVQTAWLGAAQAIAAACRTALDRLAQSSSPLPERDPGAFLGPVEALLGTVSEAESPPRQGGVRVRVDDPFGARTETLVVTGLVRGQLPATVAPWLLLGSLERARLAAEHPDLAALPTESALAALAWRDAWRTLSLPTRRLVLSIPARLADGTATEPSPLVAAVLAHSSRTSSTSLVSEPSSPEARWSAPAEGPETRRGRILAAVSAMGHNDVPRALTVLGPLRHDPAVRHLLGARFRPDRGFVLGDLAQAPLAGVVHTPRSLEALLTCRYRFFTTSLLRIAPLRLARGPGLGQGDKTRVTRAALRALDAVVAEGRQPGAADIEPALEKALEATVPWLGAGGGSLEGDALRRAVRSFLGRYLELRRAWELDRAHDPEPLSTPTVLADEDGPEAPEAPVTLALSNGRSLAVDPRSPRVETLALASGLDTGPATRPVVLDLTLRKTDSAAQLRAAGLDLEATLAHAVATARTPGADGAAAFVRLSLSRPEAEALVPVAGEGEMARRLLRVETATRVDLDAHHGLDALALTGMARIAEVLAAIDHPEGAYPPHTAEERAHLLKAGAKSCEYCPSRLGCRFGLAGEAS